MTVNKCILTRNDCFTAAQKAKMTGIVVHSTGANNPWLKRYIQPLESDPDYGALTALLGVNTYGNHWNTSYSAGETDRQACVHAFIGREQDGSVAVWQTLPYDICCWGVGDGSLGSYNYPPNARLQFEICEDDLTDDKYFTQCFELAAEYCAYLCRKFDLGAELVCSHHESFLAGYGEDHSDCDEWLSRFGHDMDWFRDKVRAYLSLPDDVSDTEAKEKEMTKEEVLALIKSESEPVYHYWSELPEWASKPVRAMHDAGYFAGASANDLALGRTKTEVLVVIANIMRKQKLLDF